jgi:hypothetical protein
MLKPGLMAIDRRYAASAAGQSHSKKKLNCPRTNCTSARSGSSSNARDPAARACGPITSGATSALKGIAPKMSAMPAQASA